MIYLPISFVFNSNFILISSGLIANVISSMLHTITGVERYLISQKQNTGGKNISS